MTVWRLLGKDKTACAGRMWCRYYTKYKIMIRLFDWHMYNATIHISTWKQRKLTQQWQKFGFKALLLKWTQRVTAWNRARVCCNAVHFGLRREIVKVFQKRSDQLVLILCVCVCVCVCACVHSSGVISMTLPYGKRQLSFFFYVRGGVRPRCS